MSLKDGTFPFYVAAWYRKSPYWAKTIEAGAKSWDIYNHMFIPTLYEDDDLVEYWHLLNHVTVWDVGVERQVQITGPDALEFTNTLTTRDLTKCAVGQCKYAPITSEEGGILNDPILLRVEEDMFWLSISDSDLLFWVKGVAVNSGLNVEVDEPDVSPMQVQGPKSKDVIQTLFGDEIMNLKYYWCAETEVQGIPVVVSRTGWSGEVGYEIYLRDGSLGGRLWDLVMEAGQPHNIRAIAPSEARRLEAGIFNYGSDFDFHNNPYEITLMERLVEDQDADYIGKPALAATKSKGVQRKLVGVDVEGEKLSGWLQDYWPVHKEGEKVGRLTAGTWSPRLEKNIGYSWVPIELADKGTKLEIETPEHGIVTAQVSQLPFLDPKKDIPKG